jgi:putative PEP-CTERM system histidine kinase
VGAPGKLLAGFLILCSVLVLANLEGTVRSAVGTARWKIKYTVIGLGIWCGANVYSASQVLLYSARGVPSIVFTSVAAFLAGGFFCVAAVRSRLTGVEIYPSPAALHKSVSVLLVGGYLAAVGLVAKLTALWGGDDRFLLAQIVVLAGFGGLGVMCLSDRLRAATRRFVSRHFKRPAHDYRRIWSTFAQRTATCLAPHEYARQAIRLVSETFDALSVTVWLVDRERLVCAASTSLDVGGDAPAPQSESIYRQLSAAVRLASITPVELDRCQEQWCRELRASNPNLFPEVAGERYCVPLAHAGELVGVMVVGDRVAGELFTAEDLELLKCLADQMAAALRTLSLSVDQARASEMGAFQMMSAFLVHDLKNTASTLSLTLKNLPRHFDNPAFREDALRALGRSVQRVNDLITRLGSLRGQVELKRAPADLNQIAATARQLIGDTPTVVVTERFAPLPRLSLDSAQIESVIVNLLLNARESIEKSGEILLETKSVGGQVHLTVADTGCGMTAEFISNSLFKPFKTSKKTGMGIGMYQARTIIEAHGGRITVQSLPGRGTEFRICLPCETGVKMEPS